MVVISSITSLTTQSNHMAVNKTKYIMETQPKYKSNIVIFQDMMTFCEHSFAVLYMVYRGSLVLRWFVFPPAAAGHETIERLIHSTELL